MCPSSGPWGCLRLWFSVYHKSTIVRQTPALTLCDCVFHFTSPTLAGAHCAQCSPSSLCGWPHKSLHLLEEGQNHPTVRFAYLYHIIGKKLVFLSFLYITEHVGLGVEVAFYNSSTITYNKVNLLKFPPRSSCSERTNGAFVLLVCFCFFHL